MAILIFTTCLSFANASDTNILSVISQTLNALSGTNSDAVGTGSDAVAIPVEPELPGTNTDAPGTESDAETTIPESSPAKTTVPSSMESSEGYETTNADETSRTYTTTIPYQDLSVYDLLDNIAEMVASSSDISAEDMVEICNIIANLKEGISTNSLQKSEIYERLDRIVEIYPDASTWTVHIERRISEIDLGQLTTVPDFVPTTAPLTNVPSTATTVPHTTVPSATVPSTDNTNITLPTVPNTTIPDDVVVTRVPGQTVIDDGNETTKAPVTVDADIPSTGGGVASILARILEFFHDLLMRFIEFLITVTETLADVIEVLADLIK